MPLPRRITLLTIVLAFVLASVLAPLGRAQSGAATTHPRNLAEILPGSLVIAGGGKLPDAVFARFLRLAGESPQIVVIPTASARADEKPTSYWTEDFVDRGVESVTVLHTRDRAKANDDAFVSPLTKATGVWIYGGVQTRLTDAYLGTRVERELHALLARGGVIGGTSAGAACMTKVMIAGGRETARVAQGFDFLPGCVVDQHFLRRKRQARLAGVLADHPGLVGFGIDEGTALVIDGRRRGGRIVHVVGTSKVAVMHGAGEDRPASTRMVASGRRLPRVVGDFVAMRRDAIARAAKPAFPPPKPVTPHLANGTVIMVGGGGLPKVIIDRFLEAAGGKDAPIVVIPTAVGGNAAARPSGFERLLRRAGATNVTRRHATTRAEIETEDFLAPLRKAKAIWFGGGRQWRLVDAYEGTTALALFHDVLKRGGVIGGSSAGTSIQAGYMVRGNPLGNTDMMAAGYERGFGFVEGIAVDQHFTQRRRHPDLRKVAAHYPQLLCIGVDEATAIVIQKSEMQVIGPHTVSVFDYWNKRPAKGAVEDGKRDYTLLKTGDRYDLAKRRMIREQ